MAAAIRSLSFICLLTAGKNNLKNDPFLTNTFTYSHLPLRVHLSLYKYPV